MKDKVAFVKTNDDMKDHNTKPNESAEATVKKYPNTENLPYNEKIEAFIISKDELDDWEY